jgi:hypothetical protein
LREEAEDTYTFITANPAFIGKSQFPVTVQTRVSDPDWEPYEYQLSVTFSDLDIPLLIEIGDPRVALRADALDQGQQLTVDLTAFVFQPEIYASEKEFTEAQLATGETTIYAPNFFIPSGLFGDTASARATFAGKILKAELLRTETGQEHWWMLVEVIGGATVNVVFDKSAVASKPEPGELVTGDFWLSAQLP